MAFRCDCGFSAPSGGDEFRILCRGTTTSAAASFAGRVRGIVEALAIETGAAVAHVTVSVGVAGVPDAGCRSPQELIDAADRALYVANARGRNQAALAPEAMETRVGPSPTSAPIDPGLASK